MVENIKRIIAGGVLYTLSTFIAFRTPRTLLPLPPPTSAIAAPSPDDPNALGSDGLPKFARTTTQTFEGKEITVAQVNNQVKGFTTRRYPNEPDKEAGRHRMSSSQEQQRGLPVTSSSLGSGDFQLSAPGIQSLVTRLAARPESMLASSHIAAS
ncbi:hypothetical protein HaLaN_17457 [Haematococcus lacustris]|uniref:Uncharacterized protein n=1 Tax=Haematococcus lacustris TaxID=44745 RepID=A0A699ZL96_HAELA|nr:hypothetical protein HaLaN_17457 [Haematococcus lacustris]